MAVPPPYRTAERRILRKNLWRGVASPETAGWGYSRKGKAFPHSGAAEPRVYLIWTGVEVSVDVDVDVLLNVDGFNPGQASALCKIRCFSPESLPAVLRKRGRCFP